MARATRRPIPTPREAVALQRELADRVIRETTGGQPETIGGVDISVRDEEARSAACDAIRAWLDGLPEWDVQGVTESPITGPKGNVEYLIAARRSG